MGLLTTAAIKAAGIATAGVVSIVGVVSFVVITGDEGFAATEQATVIAWVDGDTVTTNAGKVRLIGVDASDTYRRCYPKAVKAKEAAEALAPAGTRVTLVNPAAVQDKDKYGRRLAYVEEPSGKDVGLSLIRQDLADARYDSRDGFDAHPRETDYRGTDSPGNVNDAKSAVCSKALLIAGLLPFILEDDSHDWPEPDVLFDGRNDRLVNQAVKAHTLEEAADRAAAKKAKREMRRAAEKAKREMRRAAEEAERTLRAAERRERERSSDDSVSPSGSDLSGYTGPRCYGPGGTSWVPC